MTTNEILQANLLDILFDNRNKDYGAYALRRGYNHRLLTATFGALSAAFLVFIMMSLGRKNLVEPVQISESGPIVIHQLDFPPKPQPPKPTTISKPAPKMASVKSVSEIVITDDSKMTKTEMPDIEELAGKEISNINSPGLPSDGKMQATETTNTSNENSVTQKEESKFKIDEREPEFPGGQEALIRFLRNNLNTPDDLQAGETKMVHVRFLVGADGLVSKLEIVQSGGTEFDEEVIRVCKKMPRWKPAFQNGSNVAVSYILPVTFIGVEQ